MEKGQIDKNMTIFKSSNDNKKYKIEEIWDNTIYAKKSLKIYLFGLYNLIL